MGDGDAHPVARKRRDAVLAKKTPRLTGVDSLRRLHIVKSADAFSDDTVK
ncbi:hypothetical protein SDC9_194282 [bioreactor metagenome]|uniref:Uncharacterized protein n=1 Tax=bioreactor metagenome TaxID=1076179 RepID=A0A645I5U9_9ZZZZ